MLGEMDIYLQRSTHYEVYKKIGAHMIEHGGVAGTHAVWRPIPTCVCGGDFNHGTDAST